MTETYIALLRGINIGGNRIPMTDLKALIAAAGGQDVTTYIASGNVVFRADPAVAKTIPERITAEIREKYGFTSPIVMRTAAELAAVVKGNPYPEESQDPTKVHVLFLSQPPEGMLQPQPGATYTFEVKGRDIYFHTPEGLGRTKFSNDKAEKKMVATGTMRNWRTVLTLLEMAEKISGVKA